MSDSNALTPDRYANKNSQRNDIGDNAPLRTLAQSPLKASHIIPATKEKSKTVSLDLSQLQGKFVLMAAEIDRLIILNSAIFNESELWKNKYLDVDRILSTFSPENQHKQQKKSNDLEQALALTAAEIQRLNIELENKDREMTSQNERYRNLEASVDGRIQNAAEFKAQEKLSALANEKLGIEYENRNLKNKLNESEERLKVLAAEINRLGDLLDQKNRGQADALKALQDEAQKAVDLANQKVNMENDIKNLRNQIQDLHQQNQIMGSENGKLSRYAKEKEYIDAENDKLKEKVNELLRENGTLTNKVIEGQQNETSLRIAQNQMKDKDDLINSLRQENNDLSQKAKDNLMLSYENQKLKDDKNALDNLLNARMNQEKQLRDAEAQNRQLEHEKNENAKTMKYLEGKYEDFEKKLSHFINENEKLRAEGRAKDTEIAQLKAPKFDFELESLKDKCKNLEDSNDRLNDQLNNEKGRTQQLQNDLNNRAIEMSNAKLEQEQLKSKADQNERTLQEQNNLLNNLQSNNNRLSDELRKAQNEAYDNKYNNPQLQELENQNQQLIARCQELAKDNDQKTLDAQNVNDNIGHLQRQVRDLDNHNKQLVDRCQELARDNDQKAIETKRNLDNVENLQQQLKRAQDQYNDLHREKQEKEHRQKAQEEQVLSLQNEVEVHKQSINHHVNVQQAEFKNNEAALKKKIESYEMRQILYFIEIERLYLIQHEIFQNLSGLKTENENLVRKINEMAGDNQTLASQLENQQQNGHDFDKLNQVIKGLYQHIQSLEQQNQSLINENKRLTDMSQDRLKALEELRQKYEKISDEYRKLNSSDINNKSNADLQEMAIDFENQKNFLEQQIETLKHNLDACRNEISGLRDLNERRKKEIIELKAQLDGTVDPSRHHKLENQLRITMEQYEQAKKELDQMRRTRDMYASELKREAKNNFDVIDQKVRQSLRLTDGNMQDVANAARMVAEQYRQDQEQQQQQYPQNNSYE